MSRNLNSRVDCNDIGSGNMHQIGLSSVDSKFPAMVQRPRIGSANAINSALPEMGLPGCLHQQTVSPLAPDATNCWIISESTEQKDERERYNFSA
jgi:hypothetical protein